MMPDADEPASDGQDLASIYADCDSSDLLERNRSWAMDMMGADPNFFKSRAQGQKPDYFWIGCSDSRVSAAQTLDLEPGEVFVHRNVANLAMADDPNFSASLHYAVNSLDVTHILIVGHYGCGGVHAAMKPADNTIVSHWLDPVRNLNERLCAAGFDMHADRLAEHNVSEQVSALATNPIITDAWARGADLTIHGWIYDIRHGLLRPVCPPLSADQQSIGQNCN